MLSLVKGVSKNKNVSELGMKFFQYQVCVHVHVCQDMWDESERLGSPNICTQVHEISISVCILDRCRAS